MTNESREATDEPIAVVGAGCRYPGGANSLEALGRLLAEGREAVREVPADRWTQEQLAVLAQPVAQRMRYGCFLDGDIYAYEPEFFGINKQEAAWVDPQHRLLWEVSWEALEHAGIPPLHLKGSQTQTGLFFGIYTHDYEVRTQRPLKLGDDPYALYTGLASVGPGRLAYLLDIRGPNIVLDAQCASSLTAVHVACQSLRAGECDLALSGGVSLNLVPETAANLARWSMFSPTGRSRAFDADADGYLRAEGCGVVVLKRQSDAVRDGDQVLAVLRGSAINQNGHGTRFSAPSAPPQTALAREALRRAGVEPGDVGMIEAHGTGTAVGDPIEFAALASVYGQGQARCALGSVKTNIGHAEPASGVAGLLKAILAVRSGTIPASLHFTRWNPQIDADSTRLFVPTQPVPWPVPGPTRLAAVSSFGISGANAHVIVEQAPVSLARSAAGEVGQRDSSGVPRVFPLSGGTAAGVRAGATRLADWVEQHGEGTPLEDIAYTLTVRRSHLRRRAAVVAGSAKELADKLRSLAQNETVDGVVEATALQDAGPGPVWMFSGHGSQWAGMGRDLLDVDAAFTRVIDDLEPLVAAESGFSLRKTLGSPAEVTGFDRVQPTLFAVQLGIAAMWRAHGISPAAVVGHSMGEVAAAVTAGALDLADGARVICRRSGLALRTGDTGRMASVALPREQVEHDLAEQGADSVDVAVIASPASTVVGGDAAQVAEMVAYWQARDVFARLVNVDVASHTRHMDIILDDLREALQDVVAQPPTVPFYTTVRKDPRADIMVDAAYWAANQREPVQFAAAVRALAADGYRVFMEISPHPLLGHALRETLTDAGINDTAFIASLRRNAGIPAVLATGLAELHCAGHPVAWERLYPHGELADVPPTSWEREHYEIARLTPPRVHPLTGPYLADPGQDGTHYWQNVLDTADLPWLEDHRVDGTAVLPATAMCEMALAAATDLFAAPPSAVCVQDLELRNVLPLTEPVTVTAHATTTGADSALWELSVPGADASSRTVHATARLSHHPAATPAPADMDRLRAEHTQKESADELYARVREHLRV
ncbi:type I polyketide synthase, partial [Streptomyces sp. YS-3]|uniref:type I polyketide synthase n=1 Tax=Streptomyces sp. YS-3 TaxID=3381352 RepID=UPI0038624FFE